MSFYNRFAELYDLFMEEVDYKAWCKYIENIFDNYGIKPQKYWILLVAQEISLFRCQNPVMICGDLTYQLIC